MDLTGYDRQTDALLEKLHEQKKGLHPGVFRTLSALKKIAEEEEDIALLGYVYYQRADAYYSLDKGYDRFRSELAKAISCLQRADDPALLARAYNMVGIDACNNGSLDVAYYYFTMSLRTAEEAGDPYLEGLANSNIGQVFFELGNLKRARQYVRKSTRQQQGLHMDDVYYYHNMINSWYTDGLLSIRLGDIKSAVRCCKEIDREIEASGGRGLESVAIPVVRLRIQIALVQKDEAAYEARVKELYALIGDACQLFDFMTDITQFCMFLIGKDRVQPVRKILLLFTADLISDF
ncbi:MAG: tetratricopeptide repeat protein [Butyrivibrio sp.]|nr:tetratricopeptide repeat protein [Butyrivibrio sp.]